MADQGIPLRFEIDNRRGVASAPFDHGCTKITFSPPRPPTTWSAIPIKGGFFGFQQSDTGYWATAVNNDVLVCPDFNNQGQSTFRVARNTDGTHLVTLNTTRVAWTVKSDGSLGLGPAISVPETSFTFKSV